MKNTDVKLKRLPSFNLARCKRCGICGHFCPTEAIAFDEQGLPFLADPEACTSCNLCQDMCPDWAVCLLAPQPGEGGNGTA